MDNKMVMKCDEIKNEMGHKDNGERERWVGSGNLASCGGSYSDRIPQMGSLACEERDIFQTRCTSMVCGQVFRIMA